MDFLKQTRFIERLQFFNGQRLFATDLQGLESFNREMRWLHNESLHQPGIGNGFAVAGKKGDRQVTIGPGYAIDCEGREIVLTQEQVEMIPPVAGDEEGNPVLFDLTVSYPDDADLEESESRQGACRTSGILRLKEEPVFCWVRLNADGQAEDTQLALEILGGLRILLARAEVLNCELNSDISVAQRISARPAKQPYICCGVAEPKPWLPWFIAPIDPAKFSTSEEIKKLFGRFGETLAILPINLPIGLQAEIDTRECGFLTRPCYTAQIYGPRVKHFHFTEPGDLKKPDTEHDITFLINGMVQISDPQPDKFTVQVLLMAQLLFPTSIINSVMGFSSKISEAKPAASARTAGGGDASAFAAASFKNITSTDIDKALETFMAFFTDWQLAWMGVEG